MIETKNKTELLINSHGVTVELTEGRTVPRIGCLGPAGTNGEEAREKILAGNSGQLFEKHFIDTNMEIIEQVDAGEYDLGVVPFENSTEALVYEVTKELIRAKYLTILGETILPICHMLIGRDGEEILEVRSHIQALGQCSRYLTEHLHLGKKVPTSSTSEAVREILDIPHAAAIASQAAADLYRRYGVSVLAKNIGNNPNNTTKFYLIGRGETQPTGDDITNMVISPSEDRIGLLYDCLGVLKNHGINLTRIDSYPAGSLNRRIFSVDCNGHYKDPNLSKACAILSRELKAPVRVLGSYRRFALPEGLKEPGTINGS